MNKTQMMEQIAPSVPDHIEVTLEGRYRQPTRQDWASAVEQIKRHVDGVEDARVVTGHVCRHCRQDPEFDASGPYCCEVAVDEWARLKEVAP